MPRVPPCHASHEGATRLPSLPTMRLRQSVGSVRGTHEAAAGGGRPQCHVAPTYFTVLWGCVGRKAGRQVAFRLATLLHSGTHINDTSADVAQSLFAVGCAAGRLPSGDRCPSAPPGVLRRGSDGVPQEVTAGATEAPAARPAGSSGCRHRHPGDPRRDGHRSAGCADEPGRSPKSVGGSTRKWERRDERSGE